MDVPAVLTRVALPGAFLQKRTGTWASVEVLTTAVARLTRKQKSGKWRAARFFLTSQATSLSRTDFALGVHLGRRTQTAAKGSLTLRAVLASSR